LHFDLFYAIVKFVVSLLQILNGAVQVIEVDIAVDACRREAHIVVKPGDAPDAVSVADVLHALWAFTGVEVEDVDLFVALASSAGKQVSTVGKPDFLAALDAE